MAQPVPVGTEPVTAPVIVIDFGAQYAQLIARRVREANVYSEVLPHTEPVESILERRPAAVILSGGPSSVYEQGAPAVDPRLFEAGIPILGICYGFQAMAAALGGRVARTDVAEFGSTPAIVDQTSPMFVDLHLDGRADAAANATKSLRRTVWMSHRDAVVDLPDGFRSVASTDGAPVAAFEDATRGLYGVQWHPEVIHSEGGQQTIESFLWRCAGIEPRWTTSSIIDDSVKSIADQVGAGEVICALSGGVDSAVAAALVHRAVGDRLTCVFVDHGFLRRGEAEQVEEDFVRATGVKLVSVDARDRFLRCLDALDDPADPESKRKAIGREFIRVFEEKAAELFGVRRPDHPESSIHTVADTDQDFPFLVQGTLYPDVVESGGGAGASVIKTHHNVGGLPPDMQFQLVEPLRKLFKDEVRSVGRELGLPGAIVGRHPFPGPGLAIRILGRVTAERLDVLRRADAIVREEMTGAGVDEDIWQCPVVLLADVRSVGVQGDGRTYGHPIVLRPVSSEDAMTADWSRLSYDLLARISNRITNEVDQVNRVVLDITSKPPGTIEWE